MHSFLAAWEEFCQSEREFQRSGMGLDGWGGGGVSALSVTPGHGKKCFVSSGFKAGDAGRQDIPALQQRS